MPWARPETERVASAQARATGRRALNGEAFPPFSADPGSWATAGDGRSRARRCGTSPQPCASTAGSAWRETSPDPPAGGAPQGKPGNREKCQSVIKERPRLTEQGASDSGVEARLLLKPSTLSLPTFLGQQQLRITKCIGGIFGRLDSGAGRDREGPRFVSWYGVRRPPWRRRTGFTGSKRRGIIARSRERTTLCLSIR